MRYSENECKYNEKSENATKYYMKKRRNVLKLKNS